MAQLDLPAELLAKTPAQARQTNQKRVITGPRNNTHSPGDMILSMASIDQADWLVLIYKKKEENDTKANKEII